MALPLHQLSSIPINAPFVERTNDLRAPLTDYEMGGVALYDASQGLQVKLWTAYVDGEDVWLTADYETPVLLFSLPGIREISLAFDQNMRPFIAFLQHSTAKYWWYDPVTAQMTFTTIPGQVITPRCTLDDKRKMQTGTSDILLAYVRDNNLCYREQRDRFLIEYVLREDVNAELVTIGMATNNRIRFKLRTLLPEA